MLQSAEWRAAITGWEAASFRDLSRPLPHQQDDQRPTLLIYGKLTPATGNAETARRYAAAWSPQAEIRFRPTPNDIASPPALAREARRLQEFAWRERLDIAFGIHLYRAGAPLAAAFASADAPPLPFGLLASGLEADVLQMLQHTGSRGTAKRFRQAGADGNHCQANGQFTDGEIVRQHGRVIHDHARCHRHDDQRNAKPEQGNRQRAFSRQFGDLLPREAILTLLLSQTGDFNTVQQPDNGQRVRRPRYC